jgi:hypothetical protein
MMSSSYVKQVFCAVTMGSLLIAVLNLMASHMCTSSDASALLCMICFARLGVLADANHLSLTVRDYCVFSVGLDAATLVV